MKHMRLTFSILSFILFFSVLSVSAQSNSSWSPIGLTVNGKNMQNNVEASYQLSKCNNEDVVYIKLFNYNTDAVIVEWNDAIFTKELKWVKENKIKSLTIGGNEVIFGECSNTSKSELVVKVSEFIKNIDDFNKFGTTSFKVTTIKK